MTRLRLVLLLILLSPFPLLAQTGSLTGVALDSVGNIVAGAVVTACNVGAVGIPCSPVVASTTSNGQGAFSMVVPVGTYTVTVFRLGVVATSSTVVVAPSNITVANTVTYTGNVTIGPGNLTVSGTGTVKTLNSVRYADQFAGADCGAKINAADSDLGSTTGEIWVNQNCGLTISTAVNVSFAHTLRFIQGGLYTLSATMQVSGTGGGILGPAPTRITGAGLGLPVVTIKEANAANLASMVSMNAGDTFFQNIALDGNKANQSSGGICLLVNKSGGVHATGFTTQNCLTDGIQVLSTAGTTNNESDTFKAYDFISQTNGNDGLKCIATNDMFLGAFEIFSNTNDGIELQDCGAARVVGPAELSTNTIDNLKLAVTTATTNGTSTNKFIGLQFCCSTGHDIFINGWDTAAASIQSQGNIFSNNTFIGSAVVVSNTNPSVLFQDTLNNVFTGNIMTSNAGHTWKWLIQSVDVSSASTGNNVIVGNSTYPGSTAGNGTGAPTGGVAALSADSVTGNNFFGVPVAGQNFALANGQCLNVYNNAGVQVCMAQLDSGNNPFFAGNGNIFIRPNGSGSTTGQINIGTASIVPGTAGAIALGASGNPFGSLSLGPTNAYVFSPANPAATRTLTMADPLSNVLLGESLNTGTGVYQTGTGAGCTTAASVGGICASVATVTFAASFADTNYKVSCSPNGAPTNLPSSPYVVTKNVGSVTVNYFAITAAAASWPNIECVAVHN